MLLKQCCKAFLRACLRTTLLGVGLLLCFSFNAAAGQVKDSLSFRIIFTVDLSEINPDLGNNAEVFEKLFSDIDSLSRDSSVSSIKIYYRGNSSVEGPAGRSLTLAEERAKATESYVLQHCFIPQDDMTVLESRPLLEQAEKAISSYKDSLPGINLAAFSEAIKSVDGADLKRAVLALDEDGRHWEWFSENILYETRYCEITVTYNREVQEPVAAVVVPPVEAPDKTPMADYPVSETIPMPETRTQQPEPREWALRLGTNLLYDVVTVANLYFEAGFCKHWSFDMLATFSPWDITPTFKLRTLLLQPQFRYYLKNGFTGHYFGLEGHFGWYNIALPGSPTRYQDVDGKTPLWGGGLTYGYVLPFSSHWGMDFSLSVGYANLKYDCFYNIENGAKYTSAGKDWIGPTRLGVSIYYQF